MHVVITRLFCARTHTPRLASAALFLLQEYFPLSRAEVAFAAKNPTRAFLFVVRGLQVANGTLSARVVLHGVPLIELLDETENATLCVRLAYCGEQL